MLLLSLRRVTRKVRDDNQIRFDQVWQQSTESDMPPWLCLDQQHVDWAMRWISSADFATAEAFLDENGHLLEEDYDGAIDEALLVVDSARAAALKDIRARLRFTQDPKARRPGWPDAIANADDVVSQSSVYDLAERFLEAGLHRRIELLTEHGQLLRGDTVGNHLRARRDNPRASAAVSLIELSRIPLDADIASVAAGADEADALLSTIAEHRDIKVLRQAGVVLMNHAADASDTEVLFVASFYVGVSLLESELSLQMPELIRSAAESAPARVPGWQHLCRLMSSRSAEFAQAQSVLEEPESDNG